VVVDDLDIVRVPRSPAKTDPPLVIDSDAVLPLPTSLELLKPVSRRDSQIFDDGGRIEHPELSKTDLLNVRTELSDALASEESFSVAVLKALDHTE
jgi:hypothetical protein